jgi:LmbE family N-acetylglucosaminyl deacetylase
LNILAVGAHPDDIELQCAGTLALYARNPKNRVFLAVATNGDKGNYDVDPSQLVSIREQEFYRSCQIIGGEPIWMGFPDEYLENTLENRMKFVNMIRQVDPDIVITHGPNDYHPDHRYTYELVWDAMMLAGVHHVKTDLPATGRQVTLYFMDNIGGVDFLPTELVDISEVIDIKKRALACHESQVRIFKDMLDVDLLDMIETTGKFRGYQAGCKYAEGFKKVEAWYRGLTNRVLPASNDVSKLQNWKIADHS